MGPAEVAAWSNAVGPTFIAVIALVVVVFPVIRQMLSGKHDETADAVSEALMKRDITDLDERLDALEARVALLEQPKRRGTT